ncbi:MAG TPA: cupin domain-containing protein [Pyrinomonadaceae bacterium]|nr:cupin domain-containing protein [Pyrinomonadaceae bacterium]
MKISIAIFAIFLFFSVADAQDISGEQRLTPKEISALSQLGASAGTSGVSGIQTRILKGDPTKAGLYTIQLTVPANTTIQAHTHADDRVATVISGTWYIGYGSVFDEKKLKPLTAGSFYTEPPNAAHFARTGTEPVVLQITGYGPTSTEYVAAKTAVKKPLSPPQRVNSKIIRRK